MVWPWAGQAGHEDEVGARLPLTAAQSFYGDSLRILLDSRLPFLVAGTYAVSAYTGIDRPTKDIDVFCKPGDFPRILHRFAELGYRTEIEDERWLAKVWKDDFFFDVIFNSTAGVTPVTDAWFSELHEADLYGSRVRVLPPTELVWSKAFVQNRDRYDGADITHVILKESEHIDWHRLLSYMEQWWEVLLVHLLNFRFVYPTERHRVPNWLMQELMERVRLQDELPVPHTKVCRGRMLSRADYLIDIRQWGFADVSGEAVVTND